MPTCDAHSIAAIVLAAGQSRRMGVSNKLRLSFGKGTVLTSVVDVLTTAGLENILVVTGHAAAAVRSDLGGRPVRFVHNRDYVTGMASSIRVGVEAAHPHAGGLMLCLGDLPALQATTVRRLLDAFEQQPAPGAPILIPTVAGRRGHPALFDRAYREALLGLEGDAGAHSVLQRHPGAIIEVAVPDEGILDDIDTPERYQHVLHKHRQRAATEEGPETGSPS